MFKKICTVMFFALLANAAHAKPNHFYDTLSGIFNDAGPASLEDFVLNGAIVGKFVRKASPNNSEPTQLITTSIGDDIVGYYYYANLYKTQTSAGIVKPEEVLEEMQNDIKNGLYVHELKLSEAGTEIVETLKGGNCESKWLFRKGNSNGQTVLLAKLLEEGTDCSPQGEIAIGYFVLGNAK